jgi:hypothetical protein
MTLEPSEAQLLLTIQAGDKDHGLYTEKLYRTSSGQWFYVHDELHYRQSFTCPLSDDGAREWLEYWSLTRPKARAILKGLADAA